MLLLIVGGLFVSSCSPGYVMRAAWEESKILYAREPISEVITKTETSEKERIKLGMVLKARDFSKEIQLDPGESFTKFSRVDRDVLLWVVMGSKPDSFELATWWFPITGNVPYKGFFDREDAIEAGQDLERQGYEAWVRGSAAFSTLGWFNDPLLSTTLRQDEVSLVNTVIHETLHRTVWISSRVDFNESLANFVGHQGGIDFFKNMLASCKADDQTCKDRSSTWLASALNTWKREKDIANHIDGLFTELNALFSGLSTKEEKLKQRRALFEKYRGFLIEKYPELKLFQVPNNAELMQLKIYMTKLDLFERLFQNSGANWTAFIATLKKLESELDSSQDPFTQVERASSDLSLSQH